MLPLPLNFFETCENYFHLIKNLKLKNSKSYGICNELVIPNTPYNKYLVIKT